MPHAARQPRSWLIFDVSQRSMPSFLLNSIEAPWGDYGRILYHGMSMHAPRSEGRIRLERTGPDIFPITFPIDVVVTDEFRRAFEKSGLRGVQFRPIIKHRIVELDWISWDTTEDEPPELPESGEPEAYILGRPHSPKAAAAMPELWELSTGEDPGADVRYLPSTHIIALSTKAKDWFERNYGDYVSIRTKG